MIIKLLTESGSLNTNGESVVSPFKAALQNLLEEAKRFEFSAQELALLGSILQNKVGAAITTEIAKLKKKEFRQENHPFWKMSDDEFESYFNDKYKATQFLLTLAIDDEDERDRYGELMAKKLQKLMEEQNKNPIFIYPHGKDFF